MGVGPVILCPGGQEHPCLSGRAAGLAGSIPARWGHSVMALCVTNPGIM